MKNTKRPPSKLRLLGGNTGGNFCKHFHCIIKLGGIQLENRNKYAMSQLIKEVGKCELCGSTTGLEVHHIIPVALCGDDTNENMIVVCKRCHARLTPTNILTSAALRIKKIKNDDLREYSDYIKEAFKAFVKSIEDKLPNYFQGFDILGAFDYYMDIVYDMNISHIGHKKGTKLTTKKSIKYKEIIRSHSKDFNGDLSDVEVMKLTGLARGTYYKYKRELKAE